MIWKRKKGETARAYEAALIYFEMEADRSHEAVAAKLRKSVPLMARWSGRWNWVERAQAYDEHMAALEDRHREKASAESAAKWQERRDRIREEGWAIYEALKQKAEQMLRFPVARTKIDKDGVTTVVMPADWNFNTARQLMETALKLGRLTAELSTENIDLSRIDITKFDEQQLELLVAGKLPMSTVLAIAGEGGTGETPPLTSDRIN